MSDSSNPIIRNSGVLLYALSIALPVRANIIRGIAIAEPTSYANPISSPLVESSLSSFLSCVKVSFLSNSTLGV